MYMPTLARFTALDPLPPDGEPVLIGKVPEGLASAAPSNPYSYAGNSPLIFFDPSGMQHICPFPSGPSAQILPPMIPPTVVPYTGRCCDWDGVRDCILSNANFILPGPTLFDCWLPCSLCKTAPSPLTCAPCVACVGGFGAICLAENCKPATKVPCTFTGKFDFGSGYFFPLRPGIKCYYTCPDGTTQTVVSKILTTDPPRPRPISPKTTCKNITPFVYMC